MCVMKVFLRNRGLTAKALSVARGRKAIYYSVCCLNTVGKHALSVERVVLVDYRMVDGLNSTKPYDACVVVAQCLRCDEPQHLRSCMRCFKRVVVLTTAVAVQSSLF